MIDLAHHLGQGSLWAYCYSAFCKRRHQIKQL